MAEHTAGGSSSGTPPTAAATIEDYFSEDRVFPPSEAFRAQAVLGDPGVYDRAEADWKGFWAEQAGSLDWFRTWDTVLEWDLPFARWFDGGTLNVSYNCLDRHVAAGRGDTVAFHWEGEPGDTRTITYAQLLTEVSRFANVLRGLGVARGDRVAVYMPMIPELVVAMLACTRIGAVHSVVFGGFSSDALEGPHPRRPGPGGVDGRRRLPSRGGGRAQGQRGRGGSGGLLRGPCGGGPEDQQ